MLFKAGQLDFESRAVVTWAIKSGLVASSGHSRETHPDGHICLVIWGRSKGEKIQTKKVVPFGQTFPLGALWDHSSNDWSSWPWSVLPIEMPIYIRTSAFGIRAFGMGQFQAPESSVSECCFSGCRRSDPATVSLTAVQEYLRGQKILGM